MKTFKNYSGQLLEVKRGEIVLDLHAVKQNRGSKGVYPGLTIDSFNEDTLSKWLGGVEKFRLWMVSSFNAECSLQWKDASESLGLDRSSIVTKGQMNALETKFREYLVDSFDGKRTKERDASSIAVEIIKLKREYKAATEKKAEKTVLAALLVTYERLKAEHKEAVEREDSMLNMDDLLEVAA